MAAPTAAAARDEKRLHVRLEAHRDRQVAARGAARTRTAALASAARTARSGATTRTRRAGGPGRAPPGAGGKSSGRTRATRRSSEPRRTTRRDAPRSGKPTGAARPGIPTCRRCAPRAPGVRPAPGCAASEPTARAAPAAAPTRRAGTTQGPARTPLEQTAGPGSQAFQPRGPARPQGLGGRGRAGRCEGGEKQREPERRARTRTRASGKRPPSDAIHVKRAHGHDDDRAAPSRALLRGTDALTPFRGHVICPWCLEGRDHPTAERSPS